MCSGKYREFNNFCYWRWLSRFSCLITDSAILGFVVFVRDIVNFKISDECTRLRLPCTFLNISTNATLWPKYLKRIRLYISASEKALFVTWNTFTKHAGKSSRFESNLDKCIQSGKLFTLLDEYDLSLEGVNLTLT